MTGFIIQSLNYKINELSSWPIGKDNRMKTDNVYDAEIALMVNGIRKGLKTLVSFAWIGVVLKTCACDVKVTWILSPLESDDSSGYFLVERIDGIRL